MRCASYGVVVLLLLLSVAGCQESSTDSARKPAVSPSLPPAPPVPPPAVKKRTNRPKEKKPTPKNNALKKKVSPAKKKQTQGQKTAAKPKPKAPTSKPTNPPPGRRFATKNDRYGPGQPAVKFHEYYAVPIWGRFLSDGRLLLTAKVKFSAQRFEGPYWFYIDPATDNVLDRVDVAAIGTVQTRAAPDGATAVTLASDKAYYFDLKHHAAAQQISTKKIGNKKIGTVRFQCAAFSPDGKLLVLGATNKVLLWDTAKHRLVRGLPTTAPVELAAVSADNTFAALNSAGKVGVWDLTSGRLRVCPDRGLFGCSAMALMPDGQTVLVATESLGSVRLLATNLMRIIHLASGRATVAFKAQEPISCVAVSKDGKRVVSGSPSGKVVLWNAGTGARIREIYRHKKRVRQVDITPDGRYVLSISDDAKLAVTPVAAKNKKH